MCPACAPFGASTAGMRSGGVGCEGTAMFEQLRDSGLGWVFMGWWRLSLLMGRGCVVESSSVATTRWQLLHYDALDGGCIAGTL